MSKVKQKPFFQRKNTHSDHNSVRVNSTWVGFIGFFYFLFQLSLASGQTLIMNEVSNGPTGNQEYVEFVVVSNTVTYDCNSSAPPCIDIRGWIFDDNSGYHGPDGVAVGAVRFSQDPLWACVPLGTIILLYNDGDRNPSIPADDITMSDNNCKIIAPLNSTLFETNLTTPGAIACSYPAVGWTSGGNWTNTVLANVGDCARIVNLSGCEVFSVCYGTDNLNNLIYFPTTGSQKVFYFNDGNPNSQANWTSGSANPSPGDQTPGAPNNALNAAYIGQFNNFCSPIPPLNVTASSVDAGCTCNGTASATASGSIAGYTYVWTDINYNPIGQNTANASGLCAGTYHVIATSHIGCNDTATVTISSTSSTSASINSTAICAGNTATLTTTPSVGGGTYSWSPGGETTQSITVNPVSTTTYSCTYTLAGCSTIATGTITVNQIPTLSTNSSSICTGSSATLTASPSVAGGNYLWSPGGETTDFITVTPASTSNYTVTYSLGGCSTTSSATVTVNNAPTITTTNASICSGQSATLTAAGGSTYLWSNGSSGSSLSDSPTTTTTYTVTGTSNGCSSTATATITVNPSPTVTVNSATICAGTNATLTANGATTYLWSNGSTSNQITVTPNTTTTYSVTGSTGGCTTTAAATVTISTPFTVSAGIDDTLCNGASTTLNTITAIVPSNYLWSPAAGLSSTSIANPVANPSASTIYTITITDAIGCTATDYISIFISPAINIAITPTNVLCNGGSNGSAAVLVNGGLAPYSYSWSNGSQAAIASNLSAGNYSVTITDAANCSSTSSVVLTEPAALNGTLTSSIDARCNGACNGSATVSVTGGVGAYTYSWNTNPIQNTITAGSLCAGNYTCTVNDANSCTTQISAVISQPTPVVVNSIADAFSCRGIGTDLSASANGGTGAYAYSWSPAAGLNSTTTATPHADPATATTYSVIATDVNGCASLPELVTVNLFSNTTLLMSNASTICEGSSTQLIGIASNGNGGPYTYTWSPAAGLSNPNIYNPIASPATNTNYQLTVNDGCTPPVVSSVAITVSPAPQPDFTADNFSGCPPICVNFTNATPNGIGLNYQWNFGNGEGTGLGADAYHCFNRAGVYSITLLATNSVGCLNDTTYDQLIEVYENPSADFTWSPDPVGFFAPVVTFQNQSTPDVNYWQWNFGDGSNSTQANPLHTYSNLIDSTYITRLIVENADGCRDTITKFIVISPEFTFYVPNAFSPNDDGINDTFNASGTGITGFDLRILNRWGETIYHTENMNEPWNGKRNNTDLNSPVDVYIWIIELTDFSGEKHSYTGRVSLVY